MSIFSRKEMRGLKHFIQECLACRSKADESKRVTKELANIRTNFASSGMNGYQRKKYVAKLLYIHLMGYSFDFGFDQMTELVSSTKFSEKQIGYITIGVYFNGNYELASLFIERMRREIVSNEHEPFRCLALCAAANIGGKEIAEALSGLILQVLKNPKVDDFVKKKAALALVRLYGDAPMAFVCDDDTENVLISLLKSGSNLGVQLSGASLILLLMKQNLGKFTAVFPIVLNSLTELLCRNDCPSSYVYGDVPAPWLVLKFMRILQYKSEWSEEDVAKMRRIFTACVKSEDATANVKQIHAAMILLFEAIHLVIAVQLDSDTLTQSAKILGDFLASRKSNVRYMALETLTSLVTTAPDVIPSLDKYRQTLFQALRDPDNSIRRRALSLLYVLCTPESAQEIVGELLNYLKFADASMREALCLKIAVLSESYMTDVAWYIDTLLSLITIAGDECDDGVWYRVVQVVSMRPSCQRYATRTAYYSMTSSIACDALVKLAAQLVGEYCHLLDQQGEIVEQLKNKFFSASDDAKSIIVSALAKIGARCPPCRPSVVEFLDKLRSNEIIDVQQKAIEYYMILTVFQQAIPVIFKAMPAFEEKENFLFRKVNDEDMGAAQVMKTEEEEEYDEDQDEQALVTTVPVQDPEAAQRVNLPATSVPQPVAKETPVQPLTQQQPESGTGDLLGMMAESPAQPQVRPTAAPQAGSLEDLMSMDIQAPAAPVGPSPDILFKGFIMNDTGVAYEDANVQVMLAVQAQGINALLNFNIRNKSNQQLANLKLHFIPSPWFRITPRTGPPVVPPGGAVLYQFLLTLVAPYNDDSTYVFGYTIMGQSPQELKMKVPLFITRYVNPMPMDQNMFFSRWGQFSAPNQCATASGMLPPGDPNQFITGVLNGVLRLPVLPLPLPAFNVCGAGVIQTESGSHGILARVYVFENAGRHGVSVEVRGTSPQITSAIQHVLNYRFA